jgi:hypothetical protein
VPEQLLIADLLFITGTFFLLGELKDVLDLKLVGGVRRGMGVSDIVEEELVSGGRLVQRSNGCIQLQVVGVELIDVAVIFSLNQSGEHLDVLNRLKHLQLVFHLLLAV